jgi:hypothetical protein
MNFSDVEWIRFRIQNPLFPPWPIPTASRSQDNEVTFQFSAIVSLCDLWLLEYSVHFLQTKNCLLFRFDWSLASWFMFRRQNHVWFISRWYSEYELILFWNESKYILNCITKKKIDSAVVTVIKFVRAICLSLENNSNTKMYNL